MNLEDIDKVLSEAPAEKSRYFEEWQNDKLEEERIRAEIYLEKCQKPVEIEGKQWKIPVAQIEALVDRDERVLEVKKKRIKSEAQFHYAKDQLEAFMEIARNRRAEMKNIEPAI